MEKINWRRAIFTAIGVSSVIIGMIFYNAIKERRDDGSYYLGKDSDVIVESKKLKVYKVERL